MFKLKTNEMMKLKKMFLVIAITAASAGMVMAQNNGGEKKAKQKTEKTQKGEFKGKESNGPQDSDNSEMDPEKRAEKMTVKMTKKLSLTPAQVVQVKAANLDYVTRMKAVHERKQQGEDKEGLKKHGKLVRQEYDAKIRSILTAEQLPKWEKMKKEAKEKKGKKGSQKGGKKAEKGKGKAEKGEKQKKDKE